LVSLRNSSGDSCGRLNFFQLRYPHLQRRDAATALKNHKNPRRQGTYSNYSLASVSCTALHVNATPAAPNVDKRAAK